MSQDDRTVGNEVQNIESLLSAIIYYLLLVESGKDFSPSHHDKIYLPST